MSIKAKIRTIPDYPKNGIMFRDITTLIKDPVGFRLVIDNLAQHYVSDDLGFEFDTVVGVESRGFILGGALSYVLGLGFIPIRKRGKLPGDTEQQEYTLEYGTDIIEIHRDAINPGNRVILVDDLLATGGTAHASAKLVEKLGGTVEEICFIVDLPDVGGHKKLVEAGYRVFCLTEFEGE